MRTVVDHNGNHFDSYKDMADCYGISYKTLATRLHRGFCIKDALTLPVGEAKTKKKTKVEISVTPTSKVIETNTEATIPVLKPKVVIKTEEPAAPVKKDNNPVVIESKACIDNDGDLSQKELTEYAEKLKKETVLKTEKKVEAVDHPAHYQGKIECIDCIDSAIGELKGIEAFCVGNAIKYLFRFKKKNGCEDLKKAIFYIDYVIGNKHEA